MKCDKNKQEQLRLKNFGDLNNPTFGGSINEYINNDIL